MTVGELKALISFLPDNIEFTTWAGRRVDFHISTWDTDPPMYAVIMDVGDKIIATPSPEETKAADDFFVSVSDHVIIRQTETTVAPKLDDLGILMRKGEENK